MTFEEWHKTTMLPAECDDEEVVQGMRVCWEDAYLLGYAKGKREETNQIVEECLDIVASEAKDCGCSHEIERQIRKEFRGEAD